MARKKFYGYVYSVVVCPACSGDLTKNGGIDIECVSDEGSDMGMHPDHLDHRGVLQDESGLVACGKHSRTVCGHCGEELIDYENGFEYGGGDQAEKKAVEKALAEVASWPKEPEQNLTEAQFRDKVLRCLKRCQIACYGATYTPGPTIHISFKGQKFTMIVNAD